MDFIKELTPAIALIFLAIVCLLSFIFKRKLIASPEKMKEVAQIDNSHTITDKHLMLRSTIILALVILGFMTHDIIHIETCVVAMLGASFLLILKNQQTF